MVSRELENWRIGCWGQKTSQNFCAHLEDEQTKAPEDENRLPEALDVERLSRDPQQRLCEFKSGPLILTLHNPTLRESGLLHLYLFFSFKLKK